MAKTYINASKNAGLKTNRITRKKKKEFINVSARDEKNRGGLLEGAGYLLGSGALGVAGVVEGAGDILAAGSDLLRGDTAMAKYRFMDNDTAEAQQKLTEWYNPNKAMQVAGDVSSGIGNSLVFMLPYVGPYLAAAGYTGMGISNAAEKTGDVGLKEIGYGAVSGGMEFALDKLTGGIGKASKNVGSAVARKLGREAGESVAKATGKTAASKLAGAITGKTGRGLLSSVLIESGKGALGEAVEESLTEIIDPGLLKLFNIDENAELDWKQVAYAGLIGGLSGGLMTAGPAAVNYQSSVKAGRSIRESGQAESIINYAKTTALNAANRKRERYKAAGEQKLTPKEDATVIGKTYTGAKNLVNSFQNSRAESRVKAMAEKVEKNVKAYESYMSNPKKTAKELEVSDAILGELRGNLFLLENATLLEVYEEAVLELDQEDKQNLVNDLNARAKEQKGKSDYTVADLEANTDDILTSIAAKHMTDDQYGEIDRFFKKRKKATAEAKPAETTPQAAAQTAQGAEVAEADQLPTQNKKPVTPRFAGNGAVRIAEGKQVKDLRLSDNQYVAYKAAEILAPNLGADIELHENLDKDGRQVNGYFDQRTNTLHININARRGTSGKQIALYTLGHEATHYVKQWSGEKYNALADFVFNKLGGDAETLITDKLATLRTISDYQTMTDEALRDLAREEVVADGMELILTDGKVLDELDRTDRSLWKRVKAWIQNIIAKIKKAYGDLNQVSKTAQTLRETLDTLDEVERLFTESVREAGERVRTAGVENVTGMSSEKMQDLDKKYSSAEAKSQEMLDFYDSVLNMKDKSNVSKRQKKLGAVSEAHAKLVAETIKKETGKTVDFSGYELWIDGSAVEHIERRHGKNGQRDNSMENREDVARIPWIANSADRASILKKDNGSFDLDDQYKNADDSPSYKVRVEYQIGDSTFYVAECVPEAKNKRMHIISAYIEKGSRGQELNMDSSESPQLTSKTLLDSNATNNSVPQNSDSVNRKFSISEENPSDTSDRRYSIEPTSDIDPDTEPTKDEETDTYTGEVLPPKVGQFRQKLANVLGTMIETTEEYRVLKDFEENIAHLDHLQDDINELNDRAAKLREVQFGPYTDEERSAAAKKLQELYKQRNKLEDEMAEGDKKLTKLRQLAPVQNLLKREYEKQRETQKNIFETRYKSKQEAKETTEERRKVRRIYNRVHRLLFSPNRKRGVPYEMTPLVAEALKTANMDVEAIQKLAELEEKLSALEKEAVPNEDKIAELEKKIMDQETLVAKMKDQTEFMVKLYEKTKDIKEGAGSLVFDETALEKLKALQEEIGNTAIRNMDKKQLKALKEFYNLLHKRITTANNTFATERTLKISDLGQKASTEAAESKPLKVLSPTGKEWAAMSGIRNFFWKNLKPLTVFEAIGSKTFADLFQNVLNGEDTWARDIVEAREKILKARETHGYKDWDLDARTEVQTGSGPVSLNLRERMALYALSFRENAESHLQGGGFVLDPMATEETKIKGLSVDALKKRLNDSKLYVMDKEMLGKLAAGLTKEQKEYVREMQAYLTELGKKGNEVSRKLYGIDIFTEEFYFPMKVRSVYLDAQTGKTGDPNLKNMGMTKEIVPNAKNPLVLQGFDEIMVDHINNMATYHAFVLPMEDLRRVLNYKPVNYKTDENGDVILNDDGLPVADSEAAKQYDTLQAVIESKYGQKANDYIIQLMRDLNGGARRDAAAGIIDRGITAFKRASTMASLSVLVQQPTSIFRAAAYIEPKYLFGNAAIVDFKKHKELWERVKKYAPVAIIKEIGGYDTGVGARTGDYLNAAEYGKGERLKGFATDANYRAEVFGMGAAYADEMAWIQIFEACVSEQADKLKQKRDSDAVLEAAGKRFEEIVRHTQVYDSTLTRSENMRSKDTGAKMATAFMSEPTTVVSMIAEGIMKAERGDVKFLRNTAGSVAASIIVNSLASSLVYALRDDDEEKTYGEKYISKLAMETAEGFNPLEYFPVFRDVMSMIKGYEIERTDMALVGDLLNQVQSLTGSKKTVAQKVLGVSGAVASFFGLPLTNVVRDANGFRHTFLKLIDTERTERMTGKGLSVALKQEFDTIFNAFDEKTRNSYQLYQAVLDGDSKHFARVAARYESSKDAELALRQALREYDPRITEAALARMNGDLDVYESLVDQIESEGKFDRNIAIRAINNQMTWIQKNDTAATVPQAEDAEDTPEALYTASDLNAALERGDAEDFEMLYYVLLTDKKEQGKTEAQARSSIKSSVTSYWKKQYLAAWERNDTKEIKRIQSILLSTGLYGTRNDVATTGQEWVKAYAASKIKK